MPVNKTTATERMIALDNYADRLEGLLKEALSFIPTGNGARLAEDYDKHPLRSDIEQALKERPR